MASAAVGVRTISRRRRLKNRAFTLAMWTSGVLAMLPLLFIAGFVIKRGIAALNADFFTKTPSYQGKRRCLMQMQRTLPSTSASPYSKS